MYEMFWTVWEWSVRRSFHAGTDDDTLAVGREGPGDPFNGTYAHQRLD
jgi:hypothetical protein